MDKYIFNGSSLLTFTHGKIDYSVFGKGPHILPADAPIVQSLVKQKILVEIPQKVKKSTIKKH